MTRIFIQKQPLLLLIGDIGTMQTTDKEIQKQPLLLLIATTAFVKSLFTAIQKQPLLLLILPLEFFDISSIIFKNNLCYC